MLAPSEHIVLPSPNTLHVFLSLVFGHNVVTHRGGLQRWLMVANTAADDFLPDPDTGQSFFAHERSPSLIKVVVAVVAVFMVWAASVVVAYARPWRTPCHDWDKLFGVLIIVLPFFGFGCLANFLYGWDNVKDLLVCGAAVLVSYGGGLVVFGKRGCANCGGASAPFVWGGPLALILSCIVCAVCPPGSTVEIAVIGYLPTAVVHRVHQ